MIHFVSAAGVRQGKYSPPNLSVWICMTLISVKPVICSAALLPAQERQLQSHAKMLESFKADLSYLQQNPPEGKKAKAKELEEQRVRAEYLQHEVIKAV